MKTFLSNKNESVRLFKNPFLEFFSHIHPATPLVVYAPFILYFGYLSFSTFAWPAAFLALLAGILIWTLLEYLAHRFVFHFRPASDLGKKIAFLIHGVHHDYPRDASRLVMPLLISLPLAFAFYFLFVALFGIYHPPVYAGLGIGYLAYDSIHFAVHHFPMRGRVAGFLKTYHARHHYDNPEKGFGVSNPFWDKVFGT